ncbi:curlin [Bradyrhizobium sp. NAS80.1]|uniref:curlin n=1 Tax=Bradyrhizobium sp. NAS80.1 TaxID=1680159 RepID=UPI0009696C2B|nr:curlin [Bradyrhizobium sp. NAS80.1]OKO92123.1 curlin [Bradyrhizobium sp. NAS80.1]
MNKHLLIGALAGLVSCCAANGPAQAQSADIKTIVSINGPPVVLNQSSSTNMAGVFMIGGSTSATVTQNGTNNAVGILQFGGTTSASAGQTGMNNFAFVGQTGQSATSFVSQIGAMNTGSIAHFGRVNSSTVVQTSP